MALIVEDGSIVANANTYLGEADANNILSAFGLPDLVPAAAEAQLRTAAQYLERYRQKYKGCKVSSTQSLQWPRTGVYIDDFLFAYDAIPVELKNAQALIANKIASGSQLFLDSNGKETLQKTVDVISVTYAQSGVADAQPTFGQIDAQLSILLKSPVLTTERA